MHLKKEPQFRQSKKIRIKRNEDNSRTNSSLSNWKDNQTKTQYNTDDLNNIMNHPDLYVSFLLLLQQLSKLFNGLKQFVILSFGRSKVQNGLYWVKTRALARLHSSRGARRESIFLPFLVSRGFSSLSLWPLPASSKSAAQTPL